MAATNLPGPASLLQALKVVWVLRSSFLPPMPQTCQPGAQTSAGTVQTGSFLAALDVVAAGLAGGLVAQALGALPGGEAAGDAAVALEVGEALALAVGAADDGGVALLALDELDALQRAGRVLGAGLVVAADVGAGAADARGLQQEAEAKLNAKHFARVGAMGPEDRQSSARA
jgi:hypothetical protein